MISLNKEVQWQNNSFWLSVKGQNFQRTLKFRLALLRQSVLKEYAVLTFQCYELCDSNTENMWGLNPAVNQFWFQIVKPIYTEAVCQPGFFFSLQTLLYIIVSILLSVFTFLSIYLLVAFYCMKRPTLSQFVFQNINY